MAKSGIAGNDSQIAYDILLSSRIIGANPHESPSNKTLKLYPHKGSPSKTLNTRFSITKSLWLNSFLEAIW